MNRNAKDFSMKKLLPMPMPLLVLGLAALLPSVAMAHILPGTGHGLREGMAHPFSGLDHLLAMFAVGLWAASYRGRALWLIPLTFVGVMALGGVMGLAGVQIPGAEFGIALSVLVLGSLIATMTQFKPRWSMALVGAFAIFHGYAHGHEMSASVSAIGFSAGFLISTLLLHALGIGAGLYFQKQPQALRFAGLAIAGSSIFFFVS
jgi:urease accessory protein